MKPSEIFIEGCFISAVMLVGVGLYQGLKPDNTVNNIRQERMKNADRHKETNHQAID
jgi:hypothetical protein